uniref:Uncharacterized protein n=1 Tax=Megaselia scalaris TaxID=36166 RepID=T1GM29_MEGSC
MVGELGIGGVMHKDESSTNTPSPSRPNRNNHNMMNMNDLLGDTNPKISPAPPAGWGMMQPRRYDNYNNNGNNNFNARYVPPSAQGPLPHIVKHNSPPHHPQNNQQNMFHHSSPNNFEQMYKQQQQSAGPPQHLPPPQIPNQGPNFFQELMRQQMWEQRSPTSSGGNNLLKIPNQQQTAAAMGIKNGNESPIFRSMQEKRRIENGNSPYKAYNNNNNGNIANNNFKDDIFLQSPTQWSLGGEQNSFMADLMRQNSRDSFGHVILQRTLIFPLRRILLVNLARFREMLEPRMASIYHHLLETFHQEISNLAEIGCTLPTTSSPHTVDSLQPIVDSKFQYNSPGNESGILSPNKYDLGIGNLSLIDSKDGHINEKLTSLWNNNSPATPTNKLLNSSKDLHHQQLKSANLQVPHSHDDEMGIANGIKEFEKRLESEFGSEYLEDSGISNT